ncbi:transglutaminase family protein [Xenophilus arseniciresistens]|uniref:Transglutaminase family protein n=1 Tax=Xenophilus arseniciresistens TaxID=1283306 RepID=A0AAE3SZZ1_9BURK|nr:transglutaminase family protein [Xenophilus arseniciresistens]MDA7416376.1 transglutaminase family protein [Xenophilus arseniciresistens]
MLLLVTHETRYDYAPPVATAQHMAHLKPLVTGSQQLLRHALRLLPEPAQRSESIDIYGNTRAFFAFESTHEQLVVTAESVVQTQEPAVPPAALREQPWEAVREAFRYHKGLHDDAASDFLFPSTHVPLHDDFVAYARASFTPGRALFDAALDLTRRMYVDFDYDSGSTEINTPAIQALAQRRGVCQDFSHILIACLRGLGLAARYVSGYLLTQPPPGQPRLIGADASHAWVELYLPPVAQAEGASEGEPQMGEWVGFCPTNGRQPGQDYVKLAVGRDFADVSPIRGILHGGASHVLKVAVTVMPFEEMSTQQQQQWLPGAQPLPPAQPRFSQFQTQLGQQAPAAPGAGQLR